MGLAILAVGLAVFFGIHLVTPRRELRARMIASMGEGGYKGLYSVISFIGLALVVYGYGLYRQSGWVDVWYPPAWTRHIVVAAMWPACIFLVAAYVRGDIKRKLKHPMLVGVKLWAAAHLLANGDLGSIILFGSFLAWAVYDRITLKYRPDSGGPAMGEGGRRNDVIAIVGGTVLYLVLGFLFHPAVVGVPAFGTPAYGS